MKKRVYIFKVVFMIVLCFRTREVVLSFQRRGSWVVLLDHLLKKFSPCFNISVTFPFLKSTPTARI